MLVDSLKLRLQLSEKYKRAIFVKNFILNPAVDELKKKSDVWFEILDPIKEGRKVVGWEIKIHKKDDQIAKPKKLVAPSGRFQNYRQSPPLVIDPPRTGMEKMSSILGNLFNNPNLATHLHDDPKKDHTNRP
jgi:plasmid replication initiation protein